MANKNKVLGRGLDALFGNELSIEKESFNQISDEHEKETDKSSDILLIDINKITPNPNQPRKIFKEGKLEELSSSIKKHGVIQPILVQEIDEGFEIIAGERRWRASRKAGLKEIPCILKKVSEKDNALYALIENIQRENLNIIEEAYAFDYMMKTAGMTQEEVSNNVGKSRPYIANVLRLLKLNEPVKEMIRLGQISGGHGRTLVPIENATEQIDLAKKIYVNNLSVRQAEKLVAAIGKKKESKIEQSNQKENDSNIESVLEIKSMEEKLGKTLGTKVKIFYESKGGKIEIEFYSQDEFQGIIDQLIEL